MKTAISLDGTLLQRIDSLAGELKLPRSRLIAMAAEDFLRRHENGQMLEALNEAYGRDEAGETDEEVRNRRLRHRRMLEGTW